jgi:hypothetical protein
MYGKGFLNQKGVKQITDLLSDYNTAIVPMPLGFSILPNIWCSVAKLFFITRQGG